MPKVKIFCKHCNKEFTDYLSNHRKYCSSRCSSLHDYRGFKPGHKPVDKNFKTGKTKTRGYVLVLLKTHPYATKPWGMSLNIDLSLRKVWEDTSCRTR